MLGHFRSKTDIFGKMYMYSYAAGKFGQSKMMGKTLKITETLACGYSSERTQWELSNEYQHDRV